MELVTPCLMCTIIFVKAIPACNTRVSSLSTVLEMSKYIIALCWLLHATLLLPWKVIIYCMILK